MSNQFKSWAKKAQSWETDKQASMMNAIKYYKLSLVILSALLLVFVIAATKMMFVLKRPEIVPIVLHEQENGAVSYVTTGVSRDGANARDVQIKSDIRHYVMLREGFYHQGIDDRYDNTRARTHATILPEYNEYISAEHARLKNNQHKTVRIKHINLLDMNSRVAEVFFCVKELDNNTCIEKQVMLGWQYETKIDPKKAIKAHNPMGFSVTRYEVESTEPSNMK